MNVWQSIYAVGCREKEESVKYTGYSLNIVFFLFVNFLNSASSAAALVFYLPGVCKHPDTERKQRKARVQNILKSLKKQYLMKTLLLFFSYLDFITFLFFLLYLLKARIFYNIHMYLTYTLFVTFLAIKWFPDLILKLCCPLT